MQVVETLLDGAPRARGESLERPLVPLVRQILTAGAFASGSRNFMVTVARVPVSLLLTGTVTRNEAS